MSYLGYMGGTANYSYDAENHLTQYSGANGVFTYSYDGDGRRVMKSGGPIYWYGIDSSPYMETGLTNVEQYTYFRWNGRLIARSMPTNEYDFYTPDHLGNTRRLSTYTGDNQSDFYPFGGERAYISTGNSSTYKFTGKERDSESGLDNSMFRYYGSSMGRFTSPDPSGIDLANPLDPQQLNLYVYARNNPLTFTDPYGLDCAYLNNAGNGIESVDSHSSAGECTGTGGYWVSGAVNQVSVKDNGTYNFGYSGVGSDGNMQTTTYNSYLAPRPAGSPNIPPQCGFDVQCDSQGHFGKVIPGAESANGTNMMIGGLFAAGIKIGAGLLGGLFDSGAEDAVTVVFGHGARHLAGTGLQQAAVEKAITTQIQRTVAGSAATGEFWGQVTVEGQQVFYRAFTLPGGTINVGTYTVGAP